ELRYNAIGDAGAGALAECLGLPALMDLDLFENVIGDAGVAALAGSPHLGRLTSLSLLANRVSRAGAGALIGAPGLPSLVRLCLSANRVREEGLVGRGLPVAGPVPRVLRLELRTNRLEDRTVAALARLPGLARVATLDLGASGV